MKILILITVCILSFSHLQQKESLFCGELKIICEKNGRTFDNCVSTHPKNMLINAFGKPDSIIEIDVIGGGAEYFYSKNTFVYLEDNSYQHISLNDKSFSLILDDTLIIKVNDPIEKLKKRFPKTYKIYLAKSNREVLSIPFDIKSTNRLMTNDYFIDFKISSNKISSIEIVLHDQ